ncbi:MAG TPA: TlpA disulfide reductase family protein, partial [Candidatus Sulfopaludibacter sp.]|nr:TlpA disulfide reductase family protein [Candidatus Sulfopaludibacter sp.]
VELYTDGTDAASEANSKLQLAKFGTVAEPYYVILDPNENLVAKFEGLTKDAAAYGAFLDQGLAHAAAPAPAAAPAQAQGGPDIGAVSTLDGAPLDQSGFAGKVVLVDFWATWCLPCLKETPGFNRLHKEYASKGLVVLGVATDEEGASVVKPYLKDHRMDYLVGLASPDLGKKFGLDELPVTIVFDRSGKQVKKFVGLTDEAEIEAAVKAAL